jgi:hypothetical protein
MFDIRKGDFRMLNLKRTAVAVLAVEGLLAILVSLTVAHMTGCTPAASDQKPDHSGHPKATFEFMGPGGTPGQVQVNGGNNLFEGVAPVTLQGTLTGTAYTLTGTNAAIAGGTTSPSIGIVQAGTYKLTGRVNIKYVASTNAGAGTVTIKYRDTTNSVDLASTTMTTVITSSVTATAGIVDLPNVFYTATGAATIKLYGVEASAASGVEIVEAEISAVLLR